MSNVFTTPLGQFDRKKFDALTEVREAALNAFREGLRGFGYREVTTSSLVNIAGSCENPNASFTLPYYGREAHLSQSAQIQLEALVMRLKRGVFTVNNSFREEHYDDPEAEGRRLSEFTLIEPERPFSHSDPEKALTALIEEQGRLISDVLLPIVEEAKKSLRVLVPNYESHERYLLIDASSSLTTPVSIFDAGGPIKITYDQALELLNNNGGNYKFGNDLGIREERQILQHFNNLPVFVTRFPAKLKFFNLKRTPDGLRTYSADLLLPKLGETVGGGLREEDRDVLKQQYLESRVAAFLREKGLDPLAPFAEYFSLFEQEKPLLRGGYGIGFERFVGFLLGSNDILETITYRTLQPERGRK